ncbi:uncharacterized protein LOC134261336 [Saccostrea cucullata]|uniref:uncharacterized protein LOC134261336 n=1 Tax=Saccostrea cuccullata TaxID=36930 RepID=UPI002ED645F9
MPPHCPPGYTAYNYSYFEICLKFVPLFVNHTEAVSSCVKEGGDLIKLDSRDKFKIFQRHMLQLPPSKYPFKVWLQGEETDRKKGEWTFHDGSIFDFDCKIFMQTNQPEETHLAASNKKDFPCDDEDPANTHHYVCEIYRTFKDTY